MFTGSSPLQVIAARLRLACRKAKLCLRENGKKYPVLHTFNNICTAGHAHVKRFMSLLRFENKGKLDDLGIEINLKTGKAT